MSDATDGRDDFYVGYLPDAPAGVAGFVRARTKALLALVGVVALAVVLAQRPFSSAVFEFGTTRSFEGVLQEEPYPALLVERPGGGYSPYLLAAFGKLGAGTVAGVAGHAGRRARVEGTLVYRDDQTMIEIATIEILPGESVALGLAVESLGTHTFQGEIVDSKCFLGVMKPGNLKPHRACATRCISGGIPPVLLVRESEEAVSYLLLTDEQGRAVNDRVLQYVAEPIEITGELVRTGGRLVLRSDPTTYTRIP